MNTSKSTHGASRRSALGFAVAVVALLLGAALLAAPAAAGSGTGKPQFYTDEFHFAFQNDEQTAICGFPVQTTVNGYVHGWTRVEADGSVAESVQIKLDGVYSSDSAIIPWSANFRLTDVVLPDGTNPATYSGIRGLVTVPGRGAVDLVVGRLVVTYPAGGGVPDVAFEAGQDSDSEFFGSPGHPGTLCDLLAG
jgi:hypothetical protein